MEDSLGDRMKGYEEAARRYLPRRLPVIIRVDGRAFHTVTRGCAKPFDNILMNTMNVVALELCDDIQGAQMAFVQSDEISILVHGYKKLNTSPWFDNCAAKMESISAAIASSYFTHHSGKPAQFDSRAFVLPEADVCNYFIWR